MKGGLGMFGLMQFVMSFEKNTFWFSNLKNHENYIISVPQNFSNSI
jgi:hypothetical protein